MWVVRFCDPNSILVTNMVRTKQSHHRLVKDKFDVHLGSSEDARDLLKVDAKECVAAPSKRLESNSLTFQVVLAVQKRTLTDCELL